ncbi:hypothetical protein NIES4071_01560 [Calothrix sp. NIES-4071]|nr:hypothetical protein NIES4071_01560 [Calothrix sp. NIES-4071]BAZ54502.1 hypothetical protein NIES4105_01550 [Calothrix sp. NIES-4105]
MSRLCHSGVINHPCEPMVHIFEITTENLRRQSLVNKLDLGVILFTGSTYSKQVHMYY